MFGTFSHSQTDSNLLDTMTKRTEAVIERKSEVS